MIWHSGQPKIKIPDLKAKKQRELRPSVGKARRADERVANSWIYCQITDTRPYHIYFDIRLSFLSRGEEQRGRSTRAARRRHPRSRPNNSI